jgi:hypothetical protein
MKRAEVSNVPADLLPLPGNRFHEVISLAANSRDGLDGTITATQIAELAEKGVGLQSYLKPLRYSVEFDYLELDEAKRLQPTDRTFRTLEFIESNPEYLPDDTPLNRQAETDRFSPVTITLMRYLADRAEMNNGTLESWLWPVSHDTIGIPLEIALATNTHPNTMKKHVKIARRSLGFIAIERAKKPDGSENTRGETTNIRIDACGVGEIENYKRLEAHAEEDDIELACWTTLTQGIHLAKELGAIKIAQELEGLRKVDPFEDSRAAAQRRYVTAQETLSHLQTGHVRKFGRNALMHAA